MNMLTFKSLVQWTTYTMNKTYVLYELRKPCSWAQGKFHARL